MDSKTNFHGQSMDEIVFDNRNKNYGAYVLRETYNLHLGKALFLSTGLFVLLLFSPKIAAKLGLAGSEAAIIPYEEIFTLDHFDIEIPVIKSVSPVTSAPPPQTVQSTYMTAAPREEVVTSTPTNDEFQHAVAGNTNTAGTGLSNALPSGNSSVTEPANTATETTLSIDQKAYFIGGNEAFQAFITENITYPALEKENRIEGATGISFIVTAEGKVENVRVANSSGYPALDEEAIRVVKKTSRMYKPGKSGGIDVRSNCFVQITFELEVD